MEVGDIIRHRMFMEVDSVQIVNGWYYRVIDNTLAGTLIQLIEAVHADWWSRLADHMSNQATTTCSIWENLDGNDPTVARFVTIAGNVLQDNLPVQSAVPIAKKAVRSDGKIAVGINKMSGVAETLQKGGHLDDYEICLGLESWLTADFAVGSTVLRNVQRSVIATVAEYNDVELASTSPHIIQVPTREPTLCGTLG